MIDLNKAQQAFKSYVQNYDVNDKKIANKIAHILRTSQIAGEIGESLKLSQEDIALAKLIGLLHDIGRFEQVSRYHTYIDKDSINHGQLGAKILFKDNKIRDFITEDIYDGIIQKAILNHNTTKINEGLLEKEMLHAKIIRDADKTDIFYVLITATIQDTYCVDSMEEDRIKEEIIREFKEDKKIDYQKLENGAERMIAHFAYLFDFYFPYGLTKIKKEEYITKLATRYHFKKEDTKNKILECAKIANNYLEEKLK